MELAVKGIGKKAVLRLAVVLSQMNVRVHLSSSLKYDFPKIWKMSVKYENLGGINILLELMQVSRDNGSVTSDWYPF